MPRKYTKRSDDPRKGADPYAKVPVPYLERNRVTVNQTSALSMFRNKGDNGQPLDHKTMVPRMSALFERIENGVQRRRTRIADFSKIPNNTRKG